MHGIILEGRLEFVLCEIQVAQVEKGGRGMEWRGPSRSTCAFEARRANGMLPLRTRNMELAGIAANHLDTLRVEVAVSSIFFFLSAVSLPFSSASKGCLLGLEVARQKRQLLRPATCSRESS